MTVGFFCLFLQVLVYTLLLRNNVYEKTSGFLSLLLRETKAFFLSPTILVNDEFKTLQDGETYFKNILRECQRFS